MNAIGRPCSGPTGSPLAHAAVGVVGERQARVVVQLGDDGVERRIHPIDLRQVRRHHLARRDLTAADERRQLARAHEAEIARVDGNGIDVASLSLHKPQMLLMTDMHHHGEIWLQEGSVTPKRRESTTCAKSREPVRNGPGAFATSDVAGRKGKSLPGGDSARRVRPVTSFAHTVPRKSLAQTRADLFKAAD